MFRRPLCLSISLVCLLAAPAVAQAATGPQVVGHVSNATSLSGADSVAVAGHYAYTAAYWPGQLTVLDISDPSNPTVVGTTPSTVTLKNGTDVAIAGHYAFVTSKNRNLSNMNNDDGTGNSLTIVDISNPSAPLVVGAVSNATNPNELFGTYHVAVSGNYAYVAYQGLLQGQPSMPDTSAGGFSVIDITNPAGPTVLSNIDNGPVTGPNYLRHATSVAISGHYAYVTAFYDARLTVIDISNPHAPAIVTSLRDPTSMPDPNDVAVSGNHAYVASQGGSTQNQLAVINIGNPAAPAVVGTLSNPILSNTYTVRLGGGFAYLAAANSAGTVAAIDVTNPSSPRLAGYVQDSAHLYSATGLSVDSTGGYLVAASPRLSTESGSIYPPFPTNTGTISDIQLDPNPIAVSIAPGSQPPPAGAGPSANFSFSVNDDVSTVACKLDAAPFGGCTTPTSQQLSSLANGRHTFTVQATDAAGHTATASYSWTVGISVNTPPHNTAAPTIAGPAVQHGVLIGGLGSWSGNPAPGLSPHWLRCNAHGSACRSISGATRAGYTLTVADVGSRLRLSVRASNAAGSAVAQSAATAVVKANPSGLLTGVAQSQARLHLSVSATSVGSPLTKVAIALPRGLRFVHHKPKPVGIRVTDASGKAVAFTAALHNGVLVLTLKRAVATAHVTLGPRALAVSATLAARVAAGQTRKLTVTVTSTENGGRRVRGAVRLRVS